MRKYDVGLMLLRLSLGVMLLLHGIAKILNGVAFIKQNLGDNGIPELLAYGVYLGEILGPLMIIIGFRTKVGALLMVINMAVALLLVHASRLFSLTENGAWAVESPALFFFGALTLVFTGAGKIAVSSKNRWD